MTSRVSMRPHSLAPAGGPWVPALSLHAAYIGVASALCVLALPSPFWRGAGLLLAVGSALAPQVVAAGWLLLLLGVSQLWRAPLATDLVFYALLAGLPLLHTLAALARLFPWHARVALTALPRPLQRVLRVQLVVQPVALATLRLVHTPHRPVPGLSLLSALLLAGIAALLWHRLRPVPFSAPAAAHRPTAA